jgi:hypothetical protein
MLLEKAVETFGHVDVVRTRAIKEGGDEMRDSAGWWLEREKRKRPSTIRSRSLPLLFPSVPPSRSG